MRKTVTRPLCCTDGRPAWECHLHSDDTYDHGALFFFLQLISCECELDRNQHHKLVHISDKDTDIDAA